MEKLLCASCGAAIVPDLTQPVLVCAYCDTAMPNPYYVQGSAPAAAPDLEETCISTLVQMGQDENLQKVKGDCFGNPLTDAYAVRDAMDIPSREKVYFQLLRSNLLYTVAEGIALTDGGVYYKLDGETGKLSWEGFITGTISAVDCLERQQEGTLCIGTALSFPLDSDEDSRLARFLIDFHNRVYHKHTGSTAPAAWCMTQSSAQKSTSSSAGSVLGQITLGGVVMSAAKALLQRSTTQRHIVQRPTVTRTVRTPVQQRRPVHQDPPPPPKREEPKRPERRDPPAPPRQHEPQRHQQRPAQPGGMFRQGGGAPTRHSGPGGHGHHGGPGGRGRR